MKSGLQYLKGNLDRFYTVISHSKLKIRETWKSEFPMNSPKEEDRKERLSTLEFQYPLHNILLKLSQFYFYCYYKLYYFFVVVRHRLVILVKPPQNDSYNFHLLG